MKKNAAIKWIHFFVFFVSLFMYFFPDYLAKMLPGMASLNDYLRIAVFVLAFFYFQIIKKVVKPNSLLVLFALLYLVLLGVTFVNKGPYFGVITEFLRIFGALYLVFLFAAIDLRTLCFVLPSQLFVLLTINLFTIFLFPQGLYTTVGQAGWTGNESWFLGFKNGFVSFIFLSLVSFYALYKLFLSERNKSFFYVFAAINGINCVLTSFLSKSSTCLIALVFFFAAFLILFLIKKVFEKKLSSALFLLMFLVVLSFSLFFTLSPSESFSLFAAQFFNKGINSLAARTNIWSNTAHYISLSPLFGYGHELASITVFKLDQVNSHNMLLWIVYRGGFVSLILAFLLLAKVTIPLIKNNNPFCLAIILAIVVMFTTEVLVNPMIVAAIALLPIVDKRIKAYE